MKPVLILGALAIAAAPAVAFAHHGWSSYDDSKTVSVTGQLQSVSWANPHAGARVAYQGKTWNVVLAPVARMDARGLTKEMLGPGRTVTIKGQPRSDGTAELKIESLTVDGKTYNLLR